MNIEIVLAYMHTQEINALFSEYTNMLMTNDSSFQNYLDIQRYEKEINHLEKNMVCHSEDCIWLIAMGKPQVVLD